MEEVCQVGSVMGQIGVAEQRQPVLEMSREAETSGNKGEFCCRDIDNSYPLLEPTGDQVVSTG